jgi:hypothetical protein
MAKTPKAPKPSFAGSKPVKRAALAKTTKAPMAKPTATAKPKPTLKAKPLGEKPPAGSDAYAKKKYGKSAWNNGYTN